MSEKRARAKARREKRGAWLGFGAVRTAGGAEREGDLVSSGAWVDKPDCNTLCAMRVASKCPPDGAEWQC